MKAFRIAVSAAREDAATTALWELGTRGIEVGTDPVGDCVLLAYFEDRPGLVTEIQQAIGGLGAIEAAVVAEVDWVARFREGFRPLRSGGFCIAPPWNVPAPAEGRILLVEPGRAFGTGTHETTRLCLLALEEAATRGPLGRVLDVGTGSGILAVAASLLGAACVAAVDNDPEAIASARRHAELNHVHQVRVVQGDGARPFRPHAFDLVLANLTAPLLLGKHDEIAAAGTPSSRIVLAGLLQEDLPTVREAYSGYGSLTVRTDGEWACVTVERPA